MYSYQAERPKIFTEEGQVMLFKVRDNVQALLRTAGAFKADRAWRGVTGDNWMMLACLDRLVEMGELRKVEQPYRVAGQDEIYEAAP
jgi:hypothetical protein